MKKLFISGLVLFVVCFSLACISWFTFEQQDNKTNKINKNFDGKDIKKLDINTKLATVKIKQGQHFAVNYKGSKDISTDSNENHLKVKEINNNEDHYGLNFNPFKKVDSELTVTVPKNHESHLNMYVNSETINIQNLKLGNVNIKTTFNTGKSLNIKHSQFENLKYRSNSAPVYLHNSHVKHSDIKTKATINAKNSLMKHSILLSRESNINLSKMSGNSDIKVSTNQGNIRMSYAEKPKNTLLKLNPVDGKAHVDNKYFKNGRAGNGRNVLEFYTDDGDIYIK